MEAVDRSPPKSLRTINCCICLMTLLAPEFPQNCTTPLPCIHIIEKVSNTHTHTFNSPLSGTTWVGRYQKGKTNLDFTEARDSEWQRHQMGHMQVCTSMQRDNYASTPPLSFYRPDALPVAQPTASKH